MSDDLKTTRESSNDWNRLSSAAKTRRIEEDKQIVEQEVEQHLADESDFNFVKMHLPSHFGESIRQLGNLSNLTAEFYEHEMIDIKDAYRNSNKNNASEQIVHTKARGEFFRYKNMARKAARKAQMIRSDDGNVPIPPPATRKLRGKRTDIKTIQELAQWCGLPVGTLQNHVAWCLKLFNIFPAYTESDEAFLHLSNAKYTRYASAVLPVANFQRDEVENHIITCSGMDPSRKGQSPRNDNVLLWPKREVEGNFASTHGRIPARLQCLFLVEDSNFGIQACLALVQTLIPGPKRQPVGMVTVTERLPQLGSRAHDELNVRRRPQCGVGTSCIVPLKAIERAAHLCPFSDDPQNKRWFLNSTIDLNAFNLLEE